MLAERDADEGEFERVPAQDADPDNLSGSLPPVVRITTGEMPAEGDWPVLALLASADTPLRAKEICERLEEVADHRHVETLRMRLKRMVRRGWLAEPSRGLFTLADGVRAPDRP
ncbi:winged-helix domain-containing protein [Streptomyces spongiicola]|uniref:winged-helix domain-containing protein n=1 Tax=Streptomyces spongiicola TaxID=1690221 RepID=UPI0013A52F0E|nr:winged-helix domain-containing protein [Streptomyces spongiicola]